MADDTTGATTGGQEQEHQHQQTDAAATAAASAFAAITSQEEFDKRLSARLERERSKFKDYDSLKEKASQFNALVAASQTDLERAREDAKSTATQETSAAFIPRLVRAEFKATAKGVLTDDQLTALLEDLDLTKYATDDGEADTDRIGKKIAAVAPTASEQQRFPDLGAGQRGGTAKTINMNDAIRRAAGLAG